MMKDQTQLPSHMTAPFPIASELASMQLDKLNRVLASARQRPFYRRALAGADKGSDLGAGLRDGLSSVDDLSSLPLLTKDALMPSENGQPAAIFDAEPSTYVRAHQTSGSRGWPVGVRDTAEDWQWWLDCWQYVLDAAQVESSDIAMMAFSFGPFIGFWTANDALVARGTLVVPGGGMPSETRLKVIQQQRCTVLCCTPTYALHLANVAQKTGLDLLNSSVRVVIVAGEPGGSVPAIRGAIEKAWGAMVIDHAGASEIGAWGFGDASGQGLHVIESEFIAEILDIDARGISTPVADGEIGELVLTNLGRFGGPAIRYRTGDMVRGIRDHDRDCPFLWLEGGVLGRSDDMMIIRGVNVFPSSIDAIVRETDTTAEYRVTVSSKDQMDQLAMEFEGDPEVASQLSRSLQDRLAMRVPVVAVAEGTLPRFEAKAKRWIDQR